MLDFIRSNTQSLGVKLIFGLIIVVFVFWGVGSLTDSSSGNVVAVVNGDGISIRDYEQAYQDALEAIQRQNPQITREQLAAENLGQRVLNTLIMQKLLEQEAARAGIAISPLEMRQAVENVQAFQNSEGKFDPELFKRLVENQHRSVAAFERKLASDMLNQKLERLVDAGVWNNAAESRAYYDYLRQKRALTYVFLPASRFAASVTPAETDIAAYYEAHKQEFTRPARAAVEYVAISPTLLVTPQSISEADAQAQYERNLSRYASPEQVRVSHILVPLREDAPADAVKQAEEKVAAIRQELASGKPFAEVANAHNGPNAAGPGGELGWIQHGQTVPPFDAAAFALEPGTVSDPVRTTFGLHLILVHEKKAAGTLPFAEVEKGIRDDLARQRGLEKLNDALDSLIEDNILKKPLADSAKRFGLSVSSTDLLTADALQKELGISADSARALLSAGSGNPVDTALEAGDHYLVARISKAEAQRVPDLAEVRETIREKLVADGALKAALAAAAGELKSAREGSAPQGEKQGDLGRDGLLTGFAADTSLAKAVFAAPLEQWLPQAFSLTSEAEGAGAFICRVDKVVEADPAEWDSMKQTFDGLMRSRRSSELFALFLGNLQRKAEIKQNAALLKQIGG
ncbi:SurA N-terminal domain-containing protein [uncultured Desulfovibrio sp.]|uniref:SurA N-terminal domain-containing protein n=1 Tax=uncultured Desulfovibrio sp. TaxID=167968 RepID=UPI0026244378|nr:SurA N-terminal domain-containing protein [uncultured Desulfovibrio sp.]